jgi:hypothetical protein
MLKEDQIIFPNTIDDKFAKNYMLDYNPIDRKLYAWNHGRVEIYSVFSKMYYPFLESLSSLYQLFSFFLV